jgi:outer membrane protein assembly factor BamB
MKKLKDKTLYCVALVLLLSISAVVILIPQAGAHTPAWNVPTTAFVTATPNVIGLGQTTTLVVWLDRYSPTAGGDVGQRWNGFLITITKPDGTKLMIGPWQCRSDLANDWQTFTPDIVGKYTIVFSWPGETCVSSLADRTNAAIGDNFLGATSSPVTLTVQQTALPGWQEPPLPTGFWATPINAMNRGWSSVISNWLGGSWITSSFQRWGDAPESAHVLWTTPLTPGRSGGILDAQWPAISLNCEDYESPWGSPIIMNGKIYYNQPQVSDSCKYGYYCLDLYTGQQIWYKNGTDNGLNGLSSNSSGYSMSLSFPGLTQGQLYQYHSVNGNGLLSYLISASGTTWYYIDAATGNWMMTMKNVPSGTAVTDQDGSLLRYSYNANTGNLLCWNSTQAIPPLGPIGTNQQQWRLHIGGTIDAVNDTSWLQVGPSGVNTIDTIQPRSGYTMNITIQKNLPGSISILQDANRVPKEIVGIYKPTSTMYGLGPTIDGDTFTVWAYRIDEHATAYSPSPNLTWTQNNNLGFAATPLLNKNINVPLPGQNLTWTIGGVSYDDQVFSVRCSQTMQVWVYSLKDGSLLWGPTPTFGAMAYYGISNNVYYGKLIACSGYDGVITAFDVQTGRQQWTYNAIGPAFESPYGTNMPLTIWAVADGKIYTYSSEHSPSRPLWRASYIRCINITDGKELWKLPYFHQFLGGEAVASGYIVGCSDYDNLIYCIGKGPSATAVSASPGAISLGSPVMITGTVNDVSPGTKNPTQMALCPNGVPAVSDASQEQFMEYVYQQQAKPTNATGVPVHVTATDPNGNWQDVGTVTSDAMGFYHVSWTPPIYGDYVITATFAGSNAYGGSSSETAFTVSKAPAAVVVAPSPAPTAPSVVTPTPAGTLPSVVTPTPVVSVAPTPAANFPTTQVYVVSAAIVVIIIVAIAAFALRRRK